MIECGYNITNSSVEGRALAGLRNTKLLNAISMILVNYDPYTTAVPRNGHET
jgi:hypothetical protein